MKNMFKVALGALALTAAAATAAPKYPFPQNMKNPNGYTVPFATTDVIKEHFNIWKKAWYQDKGDGSAWILSPEGTCSTVSEAIAYGMLITVYMDDGSNGAEEMFKKLYKTWTNNAPTNGGMHWRIGCSGGTGSATDSDIDAALALVMASVQWNNTQYLNDAKALISWIETNDFNGSQLKPGSNWNDAFNPSYAGLANFKLFEKVTGKSSWATHRSDVAKDLLACQNSSTGLVADWCSWSDHKPTKTGASVAQSEAAGFFDDAARTPWRTAWAYYWYGDSDALTFNTKVSKWMIPATKTASGINSGYYVNGEAELSDKRRFVSSTFSGGLGLAASSLADDQAAKNYMETVYKVLANLTSCTTANGCGEGSVTGEKYYPSTLNLLYMLLMTGNMPNLYEPAGFEKFTPDPSLMRSSDKGVEGTQMAKGDTTVGVSGFWNWGAYHDKLGIGTKMSPDSGSSPLFLNNGVVTAEAVMEIGPEPLWSAEAAAAGTLKYPSAGIAMSFNKEESGVNFTALGVKAVRITAKVEGPIRVALLNKATVEAGGEPGMFLDPSSDYKTTTIDLTEYDYGTKDLDILSWVNTATCPMGYEILEVVSGLKFEVKDAKGGYGAISVKSVEFLDGSGNVIDPFLITGTVVPEVVDPGIGAITGVAVASSAKVAVSGMQVQVSGAPAGADIAVFNMQGKVIAAAKAFGASQSVTVPNKGVYLVRVNGKMSRVTVK